MDENHQDGTVGNLTASEDIKWVFNKKSKLWLVHRKKPTGFEEKTLWEKLNLFGTLAIPLIIALATIGFGWWQAHLADGQHQSDQKLAQQQHESDQSITLDQQRAAILQTYIDNIQDLLLNHNLLNSKQNDAVAILARARTLTALQGLDPERKGRLLIFLYDAHLIGFFDETNGRAGDSIINLRDANLDGANFYNTFPSGANLEGANLSSADLNRANFDAAILNRANLWQADFSNANLLNASFDSANLRDAFLDGANLTGASLRGANLTIADLSDAYGLTQQQLNQVSTCQGAILPKGLTCNHNQ